jgi:hypothetical protein
VGVSAGYRHSLGLKSNGMIVAWGYNGYGQCDVPLPNVDFVAVAAGELHSLGLRSDGTVVAWGRDDEGQCGVPLPNADFVGVAAGGFHSLGLKSNGMIVAWGSNSGGQCDVPLPNADFVAVVGGRHHSLGLKSDGTIVAWGANGLGQCNVPAPNADFIGVAGGWYRSLGLRSSSPSAVDGSGPADVPGVAVPAILSLSPNPFTPSTEVSFERRGWGHMTLEIYEVSGRCVRTVPLGFLGPGVHSAWWDGLDACGDPLTSGVYFVRLRGAEGESRALKAVAIR